MATERRRPGPKLPLGRMERAVEYKMLGYKWVEIARITGTPYDTLIRWQRTVEWKAMEEEWLAQDPLVRRAKAVLAKALAVELAKRVPNTALAERILAPRGNGDGEGLAGPVGARYIVELPMMEKGLRSKPPTQVLMPPSSVTEPEPEPAPKPKSRKPPPPGKGKRRIVGPDE